MIAEELKKVAAGWRGELKQDLKKTPGTDAVKIRKWKRTLLGEVTG